MNPQKSSDRLAMQECLQLAAKGEGFVSPNPLVGAVLMKQGKIVARGTAAELLAQSGKAKLTDAFLHFAGGGA